MDTRVSCQRTEFDNRTSNCLQSLTRFGYYRSLRPPRVAPTERSLDTPIA